MRWDTRVKVGYVTAKENWSFFFKIRDHSIIFPRLSQKAVLLLVKYNPSRDIIYYKWLAVSKWLLSEKCYFLKWLNQNIKSSSWERLNLFLLELCYKTLKRLKAKWASCDIFVGSQVQGKAAAAYRQGFQLSHVCYAEYTGSKNLILYRNGLQSRM